ncbi:MAG TPA: hypothetical protein V6C72_12585, partial [Chroococcales cyanobacterium]
NRVGGLESGGGMPEQSKDMRLGEMLKTLGVISPAQHSEAIKLASEVALPLGRALVLYGFLTPDELNSILELQVLLKNKGLPVNVARAAFESMRNDGMSISEALLKAGWSGKQASVSASRLGTLLLDSGLTTEEQLEIAQRASYETGQPIGRMLVLMGVISQKQLTEALEVQDAYREERISYSQALKKINPTPNVRTAAESEMPLAVAPKTIRLGELLTLSGVLTEGDIMNALEVALTKHQPFGTILIELGLLSGSVLELALKLQELVCNGSMTLHNAIDTLYSFAVTGNPDFQPAKRSTSEKSVRLGELLKAAGLIRDEDIKHAIELSARYPSVLGKMLVVAGAIDEATLLAALRCQFLLRNKLVKIDTAVKALKYAQKNQISIDDALDELGVKITGTAV